MVNSLVYADDLAFMAPSWIALQELLTTLELNINGASTHRQNCVHIQPMASCRSRIVGSYYPNILFNNHSLIAVCVSVSIS